MNESVLRSKNEYIKEKYGVFLEKYYRKRYAHECKDDKYKDSEENIFCDSKKTKLGNFIAQEAQLYRKGFLHYTEKYQIVIRIKDEIKDWLGSMSGRAAQGFEQARKMLNSEKFYLQDMVIRLEFYSDILAFLVELETFEYELLEHGIELSSDSEYEAYLLNKCILLSHVGYCKSECTQLVKELNNRVGNSTSYNGDFYYLLAELNFELQRYNDAQQFLNTAIILLKGEVKNPRIIDEARRCKVHDMLFAAYQLKALGYEFCGDYFEAIKYLTSKTPKEVVEVFKEAIHASNFDCLCYSSDIDGKFSEESNANRKNVVDQVGEIVSKDLFSSEITKYVYDKTNQAILARIIKFENNQILLRISNSLSDPEQVAKVYSSNVINADDENLIYEFIHILAHCINEYGVTSMKKCKTHEDEKIANDMVLLGRALMLYVSEKRSIYKSCYATTYAEAGDTWIARSELWGMIEHADYASYDVATKAEIAFFFYIINSMYLIENNAFSSNEEDDNNLNNRYMNYCYRNFDYDAIAHMRVYSFRNRIAEILQSDDLENMASSFLKFATEKCGDITEYQRFVDNVYFENSNERLRNDYEKTKYMYHFLLCFFQQYNVEANEQVKRTSRIFDYAFKFLHFQNASVNSATSNQIKHIDFEAVSSAPNEVVKLIDCSIKKDKKYEYIESDRCKIIFLRNDAQIREFDSQYESHMKEANRKMYFVAAQSSTLLQRHTKFHKKIANSRKIRLFSSISKGLKEFFIFTVFFLVKDDFFNPNNIFVMTPIGTAIACRYRKSRDREIITECYPCNTADSFGTQKDISRQYRAVVNAGMKKEARWESRLNDSRFKDYILHIISITYDTDSVDIVKYRYKYGVSDMWREARLFSPARWIDRMEEIYDAIKYDLRKIDTHREDCKSSSYCRVISIEGMNEGESGESCSDFTSEEIMKYFSNISNNTHGRLLIWRGSSDSYVGWRIISLKDNCPQSVENDIRQIMCGKGRELTVESARPTEKHQWPDPYDYNHGDKKFVFVSHYTRDVDSNDTVKKELNEFFLKNKIPVWYDKEKLIADDSWKKRIVEVMNHPQCIGVVILITDADFFKSKSIQFELTVAQEKKAGGGTLTVLPIVYGVVSNNQMLQEMILTQIESTNDSIPIKELILPDPDKIITYLQPNQSLSEYTQNEIDEGRNGSVISALKEIGII